jgi:type I restriction enzyme S subunit
LFCRFDTPTKVVSKTPEGMPSGVFSCALLLPFSVHSYLPKTVHLYFPITDGQYYYIAMSNIKTWAFDSEDCKMVSEEYASSNLNKTVQKNDILLARSGEGTIGKVALIEDEEINGIFADFTQRIRLTGIDPLCAYYYFRSDFFQYLVYTHKKGLGNNTNIFPSQIREFPMPDWDKTMQTEIVEAIKTQLDEQKEIDRQIEVKQQVISKIIEDAIKQEKN